MPEQTIDCSTRINSTRVFGTLIWNEPTGASIKGKVPKYEGDVEQCDNCGHDAFEPIIKEHEFGLANFTGHALQCKHCGTAYDLRCEE